jgi:hypothetical protein
MGLIESVFAGNDICNERQALIERSMPTSATLAEPFESIRSALAITAS